MQKTFLILLVLVSQLSYGQTEKKTENHKRDGFTMGISLGAGTLSLNTNQSKSTAFSASLPNIKVGYMLKPNLAILGLLPGATYKSEGKDRGFEGFMLGAQYWPKERWWIMGTAGLTFDAAAFYTVEDPKTAEFNFGLPALSFATGYEVWRSGRMAIDLQYRFFYGQAQLKNNGLREGIANMLIIGFNIY